MIDFSFRFSGVIQRWKLVLREVQKNPQHKTSPWRAYRRCLTTSPTKRQHTTVTSYDSLSSQRRNQMVPEASARLLALVLVAAFSSAVGYYSTFSLFQMVTSEPASLRTTPLPRGIPRCKAVEKFSKRHRQTCISEVKSG